MPRARITASAIIATVKEIPDMIFVALKYPMLLALFGLNVSVGVPLFIFGLAKYGPIVTPLFLVMESPLIYMIVKEALRQIKQLPMSESWETSPEKWRKAFDEYKSMVENKKTKKHRT